MHPEGLFHAAFGDPGVRSRYFVASALLVRCASETRRPHALRYRAPRQPVHESENAGCASSCFFIADCVREMLQCSRFLQRSSIELEGAPVLSARHSASDPRARHGLLPGLPPVHCCTALAKGHGNVWVRRWLAVSPGDLHGRPPILPTCDLPHDPDVTEIQRIVASL